MNRFKAICSSIILSGCILFSSIPVKAAEFNYDLYDYRYNYRIVEQPESNCLYEILTESDEVATYRYEYDSHGYMTKKELIDCQVQKAAIGNYIEYKNQYDKNGNLTKISVYYNGEGKSFDLIYTYDSKNRCIKRTTVDYVRYPGYLYGKFSIFIYDDLDRIIATQHGCIEDEGIEYPYEDEITYFTYEGENRLPSTCYQFDYTGETLNFMYTYEYDQMSNIINTTETFHLFSQYCPTDYRYNIIYDEQGRITKKERIRIEDGLIETASEYIYA